MFAICRSCYDQLVVEYPSFREEDGRCSFCEKRTVVKKLTGFPDSMFFSDVFMCPSCFDTIQSTVETNSLKDSEQSH
ncbi:MAG: hypothetical protein ACQESC_03420 [Nanobdellota archaeon]